MNNDALVSALVKFQAWCEDNRALLNEIDDLRRQLAATASAYVPYPVSQDEHNSVLEETVKLRGQLTALEEECARLRAEVDGWKLNVSEAQGRIYDLYTQLERGKAHAQERVGLMNELNECCYLLKEACKAWEQGMSISKDGVVLAYLRPACLSQTWYDRAVRAIGGQ